MNKSAARSGKSAKSSKLARESSPQREEPAGKAADVAENEGVHLWLLLLKAYHALTAYAAPTLRASGLGDSDFRVLEALLHKGALPINTIGAKVFLTPGSISTAIDRLLARGLVSRVEDAEDRRVRRVDLTPEGRKLIAKAFKAHAAEMEALSEDLSGSERRALADSLRKLGKRAEKRTRAAVEG